MKKKYKVQVQEIFAKDVIVEADNLNDAVKLVKGMHEKKKVKLKGKDFSYADYFGESLNPDE